MKKNLKLLIITIIFNNTIQSQNKVGLVYYGHIESPGMGSSVGKDFNAYLTFDLNKSYYVTAKDSLENNSIQKDANIVYAKNGKKGAIKNGRPTSVQGNQVYFDKKQNTLWWNIHEGGQKYINERNNTINWKLSLEKKKIGIYNCLKATGDFRGRTYTAWYTPEIPLSYGPWKLNGLPGLILEAYDSEKEIFMYFKSIKYPLKGISKITFIKKAKEEPKIEWWTIEKFIDYRKKNMQKANDGNKIAAQENNWPITEDVKMIDVYVESFE